MKNNKGFAVGVLIAIIAVLAVGGVAYYTTKTEENNYQQVDQNIPVTPASSDPIVKVTFPSAGVTLVEGKTYNITWTGSDNNVSYGVSMENDQAGYFRIGETSQKSYSWTVPSIVDIMNGGDSWHDAAPVEGYRISVTNLNDKNKYYREYFKILPLK